jgi:hypothetical protein
MVAPVPSRDSGYSEALLKHAWDGGQVLLYGSLDRAAPEWLEALGVEMAPPLEGDFKIHHRFKTDRFAHPPAAPTDDAFLASVGMQADQDSAVIPSERFLRHRAVTSGGGLSAVASDQGRSLPGGAERSLAHLRPVAQFRRIDRRKSRLDSGHGQL